MFTETVLNIQKQNAESCILQDSTDYSQLFEHHSHTHILICPIFDSSPYTPSRTFRKKKTAWERTARGVHMHSHTELMKQKHVYFHYDRFVDAWPFKFQECACLQHLQVNFPWRGGNTAHLPLPNHQKNYYLRLCVGWKYRKCIYTTALLLPLSSN